MTPGALLGKSPGMAKWKTYDERELREIKAALKASLAGVADPDAARGYAFIFLLKNREFFPDGLSGTMLGLYKFWFDRALEDLLEKPRIKPKSRSEKKSKKKKAKKE